MDKYTRKRIYNTRHKVLNKVQNFIYDFEYYKTQVFNDKWITEEEKISFDTIISELKKFEKNFSIEFNKLGFKISPRCYYCGCKKAQGKAEHISTKKIIDVCKKCVTTHNNRHQNYQDNE